MVLKMDLNVCMEAPEPYNTSSMVEAECLHQSKLFKVFRFKVYPKQWKLHSPGNRYAEVNMQDAETGLVLPCKTIVFMEAAVKYAKLPFVYYQHNNIIRIGVIQQPGRLFVHITGKFVLNVHASYSFIVVVLQQKIPAKYKNVNWNNYAAVKKKFKLDKSKVNGTTPSQF